MGQELKSLVGIDVSETWLEVCVLPQATRRRFGQDGRGWQALAQIGAAFQDVRFAAPAVPPGFLINRLTSWSSPVRARSCGGRAA